MNIISIVVIAITVAVLFIVWRDLIQTWLRIRKNDKEIEDQYKKSDMYKKTRQDFLDKIDKTKGKK